MRTMVVNHEEESSRDPAPGELALVQGFVNTLDSDGGLAQVERLRDPADLERAPLLFSAELPETCPS